MNRGDTPPMGKESTDFFRSLYYLVGHLRVFTELFADCWQGEFLHSQRIVRDWRRSTRILRSADIPVGVFLQAKRPAVDPQTWSKNYARLAYFESQLERALRALHTEDAGPVRVLYAGLYHIDDALEGLRVWQRRISDDACSGASRAELTSRFSDREEKEVRETFRGFPFPDRELACRELEQSVNRFRLTISGESITETPVALDLERCLASRRLFLRVYHTAVVHQALWTPSRHKEIIELHEDVLPLMSHRLAKMSMANRLRIFLELTPEKFRWEASQPAMVG